MHILDTTDRRRAALYDVDVLRCRVLASLLPGFRHTRTPLVAGLLWLLAFWLAFGPDLLPEPDGGTIEGRLRDLPTLLGRTVLLAALSVIAILLGGLVPAIPTRSIAQRLPINAGDWKRLAVCRFFGVEPDLANLDGEFSHWVHRRASLVPEEVGCAAFGGRKCPPSMQVFARDIQESGTARIGRNRISHSDFVGDDEVDPRTYLMWGLAEASIRQEMLSELPAKLQVDRPQLFVSTTGFGRSQSCERRS